MMAKSKFFRGKTKKLKSRPTIFGQYLPTTEVVFNFEYYSVWFGNPSKPKRIFSHMDKYLFNINKKKISVENRLSLD